MSTSMTGKKKEEELERVPCIWYPITLKDRTEALHNLGTELNVMNPMFTFKLGLRFRKTNVRAQKIDGITPETNAIVVSTFSLLDKDGQERFFEESFLLADVKSDVVLGKTFLIMSNADVDFQARKLQ